MSQITQILNYIKSINERLNLWNANAKKVEELPAMETLNSEALLMVSDAGVSKKLDIQQIIEAASLEGQDNTIREILLGEITEDHDLNYLFDNNGIIVSESEIVMLSILETTNGTKIQRQFFWKLGKGEFNPIGSTDLNTKVLELQSKFIDTILADQLTSAPDAIVYDLGVITDPVLDVLNTAVPSLNYEDEEKIYYIRATKDGVNLLYNFVGENGIYGDSDLQMVETDLVLVYSSSNIELSPNDLKYVKKSETGNVIVTDSGVIDVLTLTDEKSNIILDGSVTELQTINYDFVPFNGKIVTVLNSQSIDVTLPHSSSGGGVVWLLPDEEDYILKPGRCVQFWVSLRYLPYAHHIFIGEVGKVNIEDLQAVDKKINFVPAGKFIVFKVPPNAVADELETNDIGCGRLDDGTFVPFGKYLGGDKQDINNWMTNPLTFE